MFELDDRLRTLRSAAAEMAGELRDHALALDADPGDLKPHLGVAAYDLIHSLVIPPRFGDGPLRIGGFDYTYGSSLETLVALVELARGDAGMVLAAPGPSLAGILVEQLGDDAQRERFYGAFADRATWAFLAVTEPGQGSDATAMESVLVRDPPGHYLLNATKKYIGNGARGRIGAVFARTGSGPLSVRAALVETPAPGFHAESLDIVGLRGAALSEIRFDDVPVSADMLLGRHLPPTRRGMWGAMQVFNTVRPQVSAFAVGTALACLDLVRSERPNAPGADLIADRLHACRQLIYQAGVALDRDRGDGRLSSTVKIASVAAARETCRWAVRSLGPAAPIEHPLLEKWLRDVCALEFMEGTSDIQRLHVARSRTRLTGGGDRA